MVPNRNLLISMIFLTLPEPIDIPPVALESTARTTHPWVVVPWSVSQNPDNRNKINLICVQIHESDD